MTQRGEHISVCDRIQAMALLLCHWSLTGEDGTAIQLQADGSLRLHPHETMRVKHEERIHCVTACNVKPGLHSRSESTRVLRGCCEPVDACPSRISEQTRAVRMLQCWVPPKQVLARWSRMQLDTHGPDCVMPVTPAAAALCLDAHSPRPERAQFQVDAARVTLPGIPLHTVRTQSTCAQHVPKHVEFIPHASVTAL